MKRSFLLILVSVISINAISCQGSSSTSDSKEQSGTVQENKQVIERVDNVKFNQLLETVENVQLIDVRTPEEYAEGYIGDAKNINFYDKNFKDQLAELDKEKPVMLYCRSGGRSGKALGVLKNMGFKTVYELQTGYMNWEK